MMAGQIGENLTMNVQAKESLVKKLCVVGKYYPDVSSLPDELVEASQRESFTLTPKADECDYLLVMDVTPDIMRAAVKSRPKRTRLVVFEPEVVWPFGMSDQVTKFFDEVLLVGRPNTKDYETLPYPQKLQTLSLINHQKLRNSDLFPLVNANKHSAVKGELYSLRRAVILGDPRVLVRGESWEIPRYQVVKSLAYAGLQAISNGKRLGKHWMRDALKVRATRNISVENKRKFLSGYDHTLVIENSMEYMTEKLFDAFFSGSYPVYVGPDPAKFDVPEHLYTLSEPSLEEISRAMDTAAKIDKLSWRKEVASWLLSEAVQEKWSYKIFYERVIAGLTT